MDEWQHDNKNQRDQQQPSPPTESPSKVQESSKDVNGSPKSAHQTNDNPSDILNPLGVPATSPSNNSNIEAVDSMEPPTNIAIPDTLRLAAHQHSWNHLPPPDAFDWGVSTFMEHPMQEPVPENIETSPMIWNQDMTSATEPNTSDLLTNMTTPSITHSNPVTRHIVPMIFSDMFPLGFENLDPAMIFPPQHRVAPLIHQLLPNILDPEIPQEHQISEIIKQAKSQNTRLDSPTLADFLCDNPDNVLSTGLKHYLEPVRRTRRTIEFLATYWVLYLLLRVRTPTPQLNRY